MRTHTSTDLRFLSIDFLNTFLLTYRVFTDGETVLNALKKVFYDAQPNGNGNGAHDQTNEHLNIPGKDENDQSPRRTSGASSVSGELISFFLKMIVQLNQLQFDELIFHTIRLLFRRC